MTDPAGRPPLRPVTPVGILAAELDRLGDDLGGHDLPDEVLARLARARALAGGLEPYLAEVSSPEGSDLRALTEATVATDWGGGALEAEMLSGHVEGRFLRMLVRACRARSVLEVGLFTGYSALAMAQALPDGGRVVACEVDERAAEVARTALAGAGDGDRVELRIGPAATTLSALAADGEQFDLVFIDADKVGYQGYLDQVLGLGLLAPGGVVCVDNTLLQGEPYLDEADRSTNGAAIAAFNRAVAEDPRVEQVVVPLRDGITVIQRVDGG